MADLVDGEALAVEPVVGRRRGRSVQVQSKKFVVVINNYTEDEFALVGVLCSGAVYQIFSQEVAPTTGTPHLQGFICLPRKCSITACQRVLKDHGLVRCAVLVANGSVKENVLYVRKCRSVDEVANEVVVECGECPVDNGGDATKKRYRDCIAAAERGLWDVVKEEWPDLYLRHGSMLEMSRMKYMESQCPESLSVLENWWYVGGSGSGKSSSVRVDWPCHYLKPISKMWPSYKFEDVVIIDDVDPTHSSWLGQFLKMWSDHYRFHANCKYSGMVIRPKGVCVTSQYLPEEVWKDDREFALALRRRFGVIDFGRHQRPFIAGHSYSTLRDVGVIPFSERDDDYVAVASGGRVIVVPPVPVLQVGDFFNNL